MHGLALMPVCMLPAMRGDAGAPMNTFTAPSEGEAGAPLAPRIESELHNHFAYIEAALQGREYFVGDALTGADIQMSFVFEAGSLRGPLSDYPNMDAFLTRIQSRPAYQRALAVGGPYRFARQA